MKDLINNLDQSIFIEGLKDFVNFISSRDFTTQPFVLFLFFFLGGLYIWCHHIKQVDESRYRAFKYNKEIDKYIKSFKKKYKRIKKL